MRKREEEERWRNRKKRFRLQIKVAWENEFVKLWRVLRFAAWYLKNVHTRNKDFQSAFGHPWICAAMAEWMQKFILVGRHDPRVHKWKVLLAPFCEHMQVQGDPRKSDCFSGKYSGCSETSMDPKSSFKGLKASKIMILGLDRPLVAT